MAQNMQTQGQTVKALNRLLLSRGVSNLGLHCLPEKYDMGLHCLPRPEFLEVHSFRLFSCFKLVAWQHIICYFVVNMQDFKKDMKQN